jgi:hypothetical protein
LDEDNNLDISEVPEEKPEKVVNDTVPAVVAFLVFGVLGILIIGAFVFAGWSVLRFRRNAIDAVANSRESVISGNIQNGENEKKTEPGEIPSAEGGESGNAASAAHEHEPSERGGILSRLFGESETESTPAPEPVATEQTEHPAQTSPAPRRTPAPTPTPEPVPMFPCGTCHTTGEVICHSCNGIGGGRGTMPPSAGIPFQVQDGADIWFCTTCNADKIITCRTCGGTGYVP